MDNNMLIVKLCFDQWYAYDEQKPKSFGLYWRNRFVYDSFHAVSFCVAKKKPIKLFFFFFQLNLLETEIDSSSFSFFRDKIAHRD